MKLEKLGKITEEIEIGNEKIIFEIAPTAVYTRILADFNKIMKVFKDKSSLGNLEEVSEEYAEELGQLIIELFINIYGEEITNKILSYYANDYTQMCVVLFPYFKMQLFPRMEKFIIEEKAKREKLYKK